MDDLPMVANATLRLMRPATTGLSYEVTDVHSGTVRSCLHVVSESSKLGQTGWYIETCDGDRIYEAEIHEMVLCNARDAH